MCGGNAGYMGTNQSMSSKYSSQVADLTIRCVLYTLICSLNEREPRKSIYQILLEFNKAFEDHCFDVFMKYVFKKSLEAFIQFAINIGILDLNELLIKLYKVWDDFWREQAYDEKIIEIEDNVKTRKAKS
jgi:hypothetical protein